MRGFRRELRARGKREVLCTCLSLAVLSVAPTVCIVMQTVVHRACAEEKMANESFSLKCCVNYSAQ